MQSPSMRVIQKCLRRKENNKGCDCGSNFRTPVDALMELNFAFANVVIEAANILGTSSQHHPCFVIKPFHWWHYEFRAYCKQGAHGVNKNRSEGSLCYGTYLSVGK